MAQNISFMGASYADVPAVTLPKTGGGTAKFTDASIVTATPSDVASGKVFVDSDGETQTGTASGGSAVIEALNVTANGTYTAPTGIDGYSPVTVNVSGGGGDWWDTPDPTDKKIHLWVEIPNGVPSGLLTLPIRFKSSVANNTTIDWGDGTTETKGSTSTSSYSHNYSSSGHYEITLTVNSGTISIIGSSSNNILNAFSSGYGFSRRVILRRIFFGNGIKADDGIGNYIFNYCYALVKVTLPDNITKIGQSAFSACYTLSRLTIPENVTTIGSQSIYTCYGMGEIVFLPSSAPTVSNSNAWTNLPTDCLMLIPYTGLASYLTASNYPSTSSYTYLGYATYASGATLPTKDSTNAYNVVWYATKDDAKAGTNAISAGNGSEIYCTYAAV